MIVDKTLDATEINQQRLIQSSVTEIEEFAKYDTVKFLQYSENTDQEDDVVSPCSYLTNKIDMSEESDFVQVKETSMSDVNMLSVVNEINVLPSVVHTSDFSTTEQLCIYELEATNETDKDNKDNKDNEDNEADRVSARTRKRKAPPINDDEDIEHMPSKRSKVVDLTDNFSKVRLDSTNLDNQSLPKMKLNIKTKVQTKVQTKPKSESTKKLTQAKSKSQSKVQAKPKVEISKTKTKISNEELSDFIRKTRQAQRSNLRAQSLIEAADPHFAERDEEELRQIRRLKRIDYESRKAREAVIEQRDIELKQAKKIERARLKALKAQVSSSVSVSASSNSNNSSNSNKSNISETVVEDLEATATANTCMTVSSITVTVSPTLIKKTTTIESDECTDVVSPQSNKHFRWSHQLEQVRRF